MLSFFVLNPQALRRAELICAQIPVGESPRMPRNVIRRLSLGDVEAFATFCDPAVDALYKYAFMCTGHREHAEMFVTKFCLTAWERRDEISDGLGFNGFVWIMRIAREVLKRQRCADFQLHPLVVAGDETGELGRLATLTSGEQELAALRLCLNVTLDDTAAIMNLGRNHALMVQSNTLMRLRMRLAA